MSDGVTGGVGGATPPRSLPFEFQRLIDQVIGRFDGRDPMADDLEFVELTEWLADRAEDLGVFDSETPTITPIIPEAETANLSDELLAESLDDPEDVLIDDDRRVAFVTAHLRDLIGGEIAVDGNYHPACGLARLQATDGRVAWVAYGVRGYSITGIEVDWYGLFAGRDAFTSHLKGRGWLLDLADVEHLSREQCLALWDHGGLRNPAAGH
jgi:hypothetical protein